jgi:UDP-N-acetylmuramyl pentapeptide synthase
MKLFQLLLRLDYELLQGTIDREIRKVTNDTRMVQPQDVFVCIKGFYHDSHQLVTEAIRAGAAAVVVENVSCYESLELFEDICSKYGRIPQNQAESVRITAESNRIQ